MVLRFKSHGEEIWLAPAREVFELHNADLVDHVLTQLGHDLAQAKAHPSGPEAQRVAQARTNLQSGEFRLVRVHTPDPLFDEPKTTPLNPTIEPDSPVVPTTTKLPWWVGVNVVTDDRRKDPVMGQACRVKLPDGQELFGVTDAEGRIRFNGVASDVESCSVELLPKLPFLPSAAAPASKPEQMHDIEDHDGLTEVSNLPKEQDADEHDEHEQIDGVLSEPCGGCGHQQGVDEDELGEDERSSASG